jgi:DNA segregation ATPase FtsK/SpoIIIE-like protein
MAGNRQNKKASHQHERLASSMSDMAGTAKGSSRVSKAAGGISSNGAQMEQRSSMPSSRSNPTPKNTPPARQKQGNNGRNGGQGRGGNQGTRKAAGPNNPNRSNRAIPNNPAPASATRDTRFLHWLRETWNGLEPHHQQRFLGVILLLLSLFLFAALTIFRNVLIFKSLGDFFFAFFGWSAYLLALGLIVFAIAHLIEGIRKVHFIRWSFVIGIIVLWLIVLLESRQILGPLKAGILAELLFTPLQGWHAALLVHVLLIGSFLLVAILTFRITFGHVLVVGRAARRLIGDRQSPIGGRGNTGNPTGPSPYRGQRPRFSRYASAMAPDSADSTDNVNGNAPAQPGQAQASLRRNVNPNIHLDAGEDEDEGQVEFESDFDDEDDDPLNDINIHKQHVSRIPRGPRQPQPIDLSEHNAAVQGARQQPLPFNAAQAQLQQQQNNGGRAQQEMEPLAPNPWLNNKAIITPRIPIAESPWNIPDTSLLNRPEEVKLQILGDDTSTLAKTIQDTLRSFKVDAEVKQEDISIGPTVIRFGIRPTGKPEMKVDEKTGKYVPVRDAGGNIVYETRTRVSRIMALQNDLALVLEAKAIRMEAPVPGRPYVGVEIPNKNSRLVTLREVLESKEYVIAKGKSKIAIALGKDVAGQVRVGDLARMPHLLIAGATGAGKCLAYDEPVFLADGRVVKVQDLIGQSAQVIGVTDTQTMQQTPVLATFTENGVQEVYEIKLDNGVILRRTGEHPLWAACLDENQHVGRQADGKAARRTRAIDAGWVHSKDLRVCGNRPDFDGHVILTPLALQQKGKISHSDADVISDCPKGYEWRKIVSIRRVTAPTVNIEVHSDNHAFVGYAVEHNSVCINTIIASMLTQASPDDVRMLMVDPKMVELSMYAGIPHLLSPVVTEVEKVVPLLRNGITEMERRYRLFSQLGVRNLDGYRKLRAEKIAHNDYSLKNLPAIVIIIDELADLMMAAPEEVEGMICRLAQLARATGIHLVIATQRPSVDVITGLIKANIPTRISFMVSSAVDSRTIIDMGGAERLLGRGDMLYLPAEAGRPERIQCCFLADEEAEQLVAYWRQQALEHSMQSSTNNASGANGAAPNPAAIQTVVEPGWEIKEQPSDDFELDDDLLDKAEEVVREYEKASISLLQRRLRIGYSRAARLIDLLEDRGIIGHSEAAGRSREVLESNGSGGTGRNGNHGSNANNGGEGRTMADEVADIIAEEKAREEIMKKQTQANNNENI